MAVDWNKIHEFEQRLNPARPEEAGFGVKVIGYGEISAVFSFSEPGLSGFAYKRMSVFDSENSKEAPAMLKQILEQMQLILEFNKKNEPYLQARPHSFSARSV